MSYLKLFTFITLLASSIIPSFAATGEPFARRESTGALEATESRLSMDLSSLAGDDTESVGSTWTLTAGDAPLDTIPTLVSGMSMKQVVERFKTLRAEHVKTVRRMETLQRSVKEFVDAQLRVLSEIEGVVERAGDERARTVLEKGIASLVDAHKALKRREADAQETLRELNTEVETLRAQKAAAERELTEVRTRMSATSDTPLLENASRRKGDSDCPCVVQ